MSHNSTYSEDIGYVNIHGQDVKVYVCDKTGRILVPIDELKDMGFRIYRKSQYNRLLIDDNQFSKEFDLYMLQCAQSYMLQSKLASFKEHDILESINKCKVMLTGGQTDPRVSSPSFSQNHIIEKSPGNDITITTQNFQNDKKFRGFTPNKSPASSLNTSEVAKDLSPEFNSKRNSFDQRRSGKENSFDNSKFRNDRSFEKTPNPRHERSFEKNTSPSSSVKSFEQKKSYPPRTTNDNSRMSTSELRRPNFNPTTANNFQERRESENGDAPVERLVHIELDKPEHDVLVTHIEKPNFLWVQDVDRAELLLEIDGKVSKEVAQQEPKHNRFTLNTIYLGPEDDSWFRCKVIKFKPLTVFFVDYGNTAQVTELREASEELSKIPCQAAKITFPESQGTVEAFEKITIKIKRRYDNGTYAVDIKSADAPAASPAIQEKPKPPTIPTFFTKPEPLAKIENGQRVMIIAHINGKLALRTKECFDKLKQIEKALEEVEAKKLDKVEKGQLVLCKKDKLRRAVVSTVRGDTVEVEFLDFCEKMSVASLPLMFINEALAQQPITYILSPPLKGYSDESEAAVQELVEKRAKATVVLCNGDFDLKLGEELLSEKLKPQDSGRAMLKDFKPFKPPTGVGEYILNTYRNSEELYLALGDVLEANLENIIKTEVPNDDPYEPIVGEVCWGLYQDSWSRCAIIRILSGRYEVQFIDFGNLEFLKGEQLRQLTEDAVSAPVLAIRCQLTGLPNVKNLEEAIKEHIGDGETYKVNIKKFNGQAYEIEIPAVYAAVKSI